MRKIIIIIIIACILLECKLLALEPIVVLYGPPGSGKGAFAQHLKENYSYNHVSPGDLLRYEIDNQTLIGQEIKEIVRQGDFVDQSIVYDLMRKKIKEFIGMKRPFIIDGFVKSEESLLFLENLLREYGLSDQILLIHLEADDDTCAKRIDSRIVCPQCYHVYNLESHPPLHDGVCDLCNTTIRLRINDDQTVIKKRLAYYRSSLANLVDSAKRKTPYVIFNTTGSLQECLQHYDLLMNDLQSFQGNVKQWIEISALLQRDSEKKICCAVN